MRKQTRTPVSRPARIELEDGKSISCRIADVSTRGALLIVSDAEWLPKHFMLADIFRGIRRQVRIVWTSPHRAGIEFLDDDPSPPKKPTGFGKRG